MCKAIDLSKTTAYKQTARDKTLRGNWRYCLQFRVRSSLLGATDPEGRARRGKKPIVLRRHGALMVGRIQYAPSPSHPNSLPGVQRSDSRLSVIGYVNLE